LLFGLSIVLLYLTTSYVVSYVVNRLLLSPSVYSTDFKIPKARIDILRIFAGLSIIYIESRTPRDRYA